MEKQKNYEKTLPENYVTVMHVDAKNSKKQASTYALLSYVPFMVLVPILCLIANYRDGYNIIRNWRTDHVIIVILVAIAVNVVYTVLHELTHGITYKLCTGGKLTFGFSKGVAFCGIPELYMHKKASIAGLIMPFVVFSIVFTALTVGLWAVRPLYGIGAGFVLSLHLGGCIVDLHWFYMYMTKFRHCNTLRRDIGPEQWLYIPKDEAEKYGVSKVQEDR